MEVAVNKGKMKRRNEVNIRREHHEVPGGVNLFASDAFATGLGAKSHKRQRTTVRPACPRFQRPSTDRT